MPPSWSRWDWNRDDNSIETSGTHALSGKCNTPGCEGPVVVEVQRRDGGDGPGVKRRACWEHLDALMITHPDAATVARHRQSLGQKL